METFSALPALCVWGGICRSPVDALHKGQWYGALMFLSAPEQTVDQTPVIWSAIALIMTSL